MPKVSTTNAAANTVIRMRCAAIVDTTAKPLILVDGIAFYDSIQKLDLDNIQRIDVVKDERVYCNWRPHSGLILITTKNARQRKFIIIDSISRLPIPAVSVTFVSKENPADQFMEIADSAGVVTTSKLVAGKAYEINASSIGYENYNSSFLNDRIAIQTLNLKQKITENKEVIMVGYPPTRCRSTRCCILTKYTAEKISTLTTNTMTSFRQYPNPAQAGESIYLQWDNAELKQVQARIMNLSGQLLLAKSYAVTEGKNVLSIATSTRWTPGVYFIQISDRYGKMIRQDKLLIQ